MSISPLSNSIGTVNVPYPSVIDSRPPSKLQSPQPESASSQPISKDAPKEETSPSQLQEAVASMNDLIGTLNSSSLQFSIDDETGKTIVKVMDAETKEVIKQIPSEEMVAISKALDQLKGLLIQQKA